MTTLGTRTAVVSEIERAYDELTLTPDWELDDRVFWDLRIKLLGVAARLADDADITARVEALRARMDTLQSRREVAA